MKEKDRKIYELLRKNSRMSLTKMSKKTKIPISTIYEKLRRDEVITRYTVFLDLKKIGYSIQLNFLLNIEKEIEEDVINHLMGSNCINNVAKVNNGYNLFCEGIFKDMQEAELFVERLQKKFKTEILTFYTLQQLKSESFIP